MLPSSASYIEPKQINFNINPEDYDPLVDLKVTVEIKAVRTLGAIRWFNANPNLYVIVFINDQQFKSDVWSGTRYIYNPSFSPTLDIPDETEFVNVKIQLWDSSSSGEKICDISGDSTSYAELTYSLKTGHWTGDDQLKDPSGYGRLNGCNDGKITQMEFLIGLRLMFMELILK